jgi:hypothetical protein
LLPEQRQNWGEIRKEVVTEIFASIGRRYDRYTDGKDGCAEEA